MFSSSAWVLTLGLAALWDGFRSRAARAVAIAVTAVCVLWNLSASLEFRRGILPGEAPVSFTRMLEGHAALLHHLGGKARTR